MHKYVSSLLGVLVLSVPALASEYHSGISLFSGRIWNGALGLATSEVRWQLTVDGDELAASVNLPPPLSSKWKLTGRTRRDSTACDLKGVTDKGQDVVISNASCRGANISGTFSIKGGGQPPQSGTISLTRAQSPAPPAKPHVENAAGKIKYGPYVCKDVIVRPGEMTRFEPKGSFTLEPDGTYRWLANGGTGRYTFDAATNTIAWISGHLSAAPNRTTYRPSTSVAGIEIEWSPVYRWQCGNSK